MRIVYIAFLDICSDARQFLRKVSSQFDALQKENHDTYCYVIGRDEEGIGRCDYSFQFVSLDDFVCIDRCHAKNIRILCAQTIAELLRPDIIYMRYPWADKEVLGLVSRFNNIVFEHQTKELPELDFIRSDLRKDERVYGRRVMQRVCSSVCVTPEILRYQRRRAANGLTGFVSPNGIDTRHMPQKKKTRTSGPVELICVADFTRWHGYDRLLRGLKKYAGTTKVHVHMVGNGPELNAYKAYVRRFGLAARVTFWGRCDGKKLDQLIDASDVAISSLGLFRMGWQDAAPLKSREYCARGIPFCYAGNDPDLPMSFEYAYQVPSREKPIDIERLLRFVAFCRRRENVALTMRRFAHEYLSWEVKMKNVAAFIASLKKTASEREKSPVKVRDIYAALYERVKRQRKKTVADRLVEAGCLFYCKDDTHAFSMYEKIIHDAPNVQPVFFRILNHSKTVAAVSESRKKALVAAVLDLYKKKRAKTFLDHYRAAALLREKDPEAAMSTYQKVLDMQKVPVDMRANAFFHVASILSDRGEYDRAKIVIKRCLRSNPRHAKAKQLLRLIQEGRDA